jgi:hypothetical protein
MTDSKRDISVKTNDSNSVNIVRSTLHDMRAQLVVEAASAATFQHWSARSQETRVLAMSPIFYSSDELVMKQTVETTPSARKNRARDRERESNNRNQQSS